MKVSEILLGSIAQQEVFANIDAQIAKLDKILFEFDKKAAVVGYFTHSESVDRYIRDLEWSDYFLEFVASDNAKLQKSFARLKHLRQQVRNKIQSGV